jgi:diguanylate cyclase (GGDEF)-like protein/PAS domain S-box-containing protein
LDGIAERLHAILESAMDCIITADGEGRIIDFNAAAERTFGYHRDQVLGRTVAEVMVPPLLRDAHDRGMARFLETGEGAFLGRRVELPALRADGSQIPVELTITAARLSTGERFITAYLRDITERRQSEAVQEAQRLALELVARGEPLEKVLEMLVEAIEDLSSSGCRGAVQLLEGRRLRHVAGPGLSPEYRSLVDGIEIGADVGSCGAAAHLGEVVICSDVGVHPNWIRFRDAAMATGVRAAWSTPIFSAAGEVLGTFTMYRDRPHEPSDAELWFLWQVNRVAALAIERRRAEQALRTSEARFRAAFDQIAVGMAESDARGRLIRVNDEYCRIMGYTREELIGRSVWELTYSEDVSENRRRFDATTAALQPSHTVEKRYIRKDGSLVWVRVTANLMRSESDGATYVLGVVEDIDERRHAEERLRRSEEFRRRIIASSQDCIKVLDVDGRLLSMNEGGRCMLEIDDLEPFLHRRWQEFWQGEDRDAAAAAVAAAAGGGRGRFRGYFPLVRSGTPRWWDVVVTPMLGDDGRPEQLLAVSRDITDQVARERARQFLLDLSEATQPLDDPDEVMQATVRLLCEHLQASRCAYAVVEDESGCYTVVGDHVRDTFSIVGRHSLETLGAEVLRCMGESRVFVVDDVEEQIADPEVRTAFVSIDKRAIICAPLHKAGRFVAAMAVHQTTPRRWTADEIELVRLVTDRCWEAIERARTNRNLREGQAKLALAARVARLGYWRLDLSTRELISSAQCHANFGRGGNEDFSYDDFWQAIHPDDRERVQAAIERAFKGDCDYDVEYRAVWPDGSIHWIYARGQLTRNVEGTPIELNGTTLDITERKRAEMLLEWQRRVFELIARGEPLPQVLDTLVRALEKQTHERFVASIMLLDEDGRHLRHGASPSLPDRFRQAMDGALAETGVSPCAAAIASAEPVIVPDFSQESRWPGFREMFLNLGLKACWSTPICASDGRPLGAFGVHYRSPWRPQREHESLVASLVHVAAIAIERERAGQALRDSEERLRLALDASGMGTWEMDLASGRVTADERLRAIYALGPDQEVSHELINLEQVHPDSRETLRAALEAACDPATDDCYTLEYRILTPGGSERWLFGNGRVIFSGTGPQRRAVRIVGSVLDITGRKRLEHQLHHSAFHDVLTGQPNRALFMDRLAHVIARTERHGEGFALLMLDIDNFKLVNDGFGHLAGDRLLVEFAGAVRRYLRPEDTLARLGGDEFCILIEEIGSREDVLQVVRRIQRLLAEQSIFVQGQEIRTSVSIGIAFERRGHRKPETALQDADVALYEAKRRGKNGYVIFDEAMRYGVRAPLRLEQALQGAVAAGEITVEYQPIVDLASGRPIGCEALARWHHPKLGHVEPAQFIPLAEETGVIRPLGQFILETACREVSEWRRTGGLPDDFYVAVNLSAHQFGQDDLVEQVVHALERFGLEGRHLRLEVTESSIIANGEHAARVIGELQSHGIRVCMDDFGVGYSSLSYLQRFPVSVLKLDRSFVAGLTEQPNTHAIVKTVLDLARNLGLEAIAEGAECVEQRDALRDLGFTHAQGFLFHQPMSNEAMAGLVTRH